MSNSFPARLVLSSRVLRQLLFVTDELTAFCEMLPGADCFIAESSWGAVSGWIERSAQVKQINAEVVQEMRETYKSLAELVTVIPEQFIRPYYSTFPAANHFEQVLQSCALASMVEAPVWVMKEGFPKIDGVQLWVLPAKPDG